MIHVSIGLEFTFKLSSAPVALWWHDDVNCFKFKSGHNDWL